MSMQLTLDFDRRERDELAEQDRRAANRRELVRQLGNCGLRGLQVEVIVHAVNSTALTSDDEGQRRLVVQMSERAAATSLGASKSGVHHALSTLADRGVITRQRGGYVVLWDAVLELRPIVKDVPTVFAAPAGHWWWIRHVQSARTLAITSTRAGWAFFLWVLAPGLLFLGKTKRSHPATQNQDPTTNTKPTDQKWTKNGPTDQTTDQKWTKNGPTDQTTDHHARLSYRLRWDDLFTSDGKLNADGIVKLHRDCVRLGWIADCSESFARTVGLVMWLPSKQRIESGVTEPLGWLISALRHGPAVTATWRSWPSPEYFSRAAAAIEKAQLGQHR